MNFEKAFERTMQLEGGYVLHEVAGDSGGQTYAGIARNAWPDLPLWQQTERLTKAPDEDIVAFVQTFYRQQFWTKMRLDEVEAECAFCIYDFGVNSGTRQAIRTAQRVALPDQPTEHDGLVGPKTIAAINQMAPAAFIAKYLLSRAQFFAAITVKRPGNLKFLNGWLNRIQTCMNYAA